MFLALQNNFDHILISLIKYTIFLFRAPSWGEHVIIKDKFLFGKSAGRLCPSLGKDAFEIFKQEN